MVRKWSTMLFVALACLIVVNTASAQQGDQPAKKHGGPEARFDAMEKAVKHDPLKGELTKEEFVAALKELKSPRADKAEEFFNKIKKADENKVTKEEFVTAVKAMMAKRKKAQ